VSENYDGQAFFTIENGKRVATPLLLVLAVVELSDVVFAVDSIPAVRFLPVNANCHAIHMCTSLAVSVYTTLMYPWVLMMVAGNCCCSTVTVL